MNKPAAFDAIAETYDTSFVESRIGHAQRQMSRQWLQPLLTGQTGLQLLEINCGTGEDALWLAQQGHQVIATDQSAVMIGTAQQKAACSSGHNRPAFHVCAFEDLGTRFSRQQFDGLFSNFAGLNCVSPNELLNLGTQLTGLLRPGGFLEVVLFGKYCWWETAYYLYKMQPRPAFRRWTNKKTIVPLTQNAQQSVYYYSIKKFARLMAPLQLVDKKPVGLFIPPSYLEKALQQRPVLFRALKQLENQPNRFSMLSAFADHTFLLFKKETI